MNHQPGDALLKVLGVVVAAVMATAIALCLVFVLLPSGKAEDLTAFLGEVEILHTESKTTGLDSFYLARLKADPGKVREKLRTHAYPRRTSETQTLRQLFMNPPLAWPPDIAIFDRDWIAFTISTGVFRVVAFPSDGRQEILYLEFDT